jgi:hypothetical protein
MGFLIRKVLLMRDNLIKRQWKGCKKYCFCDVEEATQLCFLHVLLQRSFGASFIVRIIYRHRRTLKTCLGTVEH